MEENTVLVKIIKILDSKKAVDINVIRTRELTIIADFFVICTGTSSTHVRALADELEDGLLKENINARSIEGKATGWILLDYSDIVVHIFTPDMREYYGLERIWQDGDSVNIDELINE